MTAGQVWHGNKKCAVNGAKLPKANQVVGQPCPFCGNTIGAYIGTADSARPVPSDPPATPSISQQLANLQRLRDDNVISDEEYEERRLALIDDAVDAPAPSPTTPTPRPSGSSPPASATSAQFGKSLYADDKPGAKRQRTSLILAGVFVAVMVVIFIVFSALGDGGSSGQPSSRAGPYSGRVVDYFPENPASLVVVIEMTNRGALAGNWECTVTASDSSGAYHGFDILSSQERLAAGATQQYNGSIIITSEGAAFVTEVELSDCESA